MFWIDDINWYFNLIGNVGCFYFVFYTGYYAGKNNLLNSIFGEERKRG